MYNCSNKLSLHWQYQISSIHYNYVNTYKFYYWKKNKFNSVNQLDTNNLEQEWPGLCVSQKYLNKWYK